MFVLKLLVCLLVLGLIVPFYEQTPIDDSDTEYDDSDYDSDYELDEEDIRIEYGPEFDSEDEDNVPFVIKKKTNVSIS